jgi:membrane protease YdiL (CAAX protease family)
MAVQPPTRTRREYGDYVTWLLVAALGLLGPVLAHGARDNEIYIFGLSLFGFSVAFLFFEMKRHFDLADAAKAATDAAPTGTGHE